MNYSSEGVLMNSDGSNYYVTQTPSTILTKEVVSNFINKFSRHKNNIFDYRDKLRTNLLNGRFFIEIDVNDLKNYNENLKEYLYKQPVQFIEQVCFSFISIFYLSILIITMIIKEYKY